MDTKPRYPISVYLDTYKIFSTSFNEVRPEMRINYDFSLSQQSEAIEAAISKVLQDEYTPHV